MDNKNTMRLSDLILEQMEPILQAWEEFAKTIEPPAFTMDSKALRNHASLMLRTIAEDLRRPQTRVEQIEKSKGLDLPDTKETAAETHATARLKSGFTIEQLVSEYPALRSSVLRLWSETARETLPTDIVDITRFNEGIDQALAKSVARFAKITRKTSEYERQRLNAVLEAAPVGIAVTDENGRLILSNPENIRIWGQHCLSENVDEYRVWKGWWADGSEKHGHLLESHECASARALSGEDAPSDRVDIEPFGSPGERRAIVLHAKPIWGSDRKVVGAVVA
jgi:PAS domain-containing protein